MDNINENPIADKEDVGQSETNTVHEMDSIPSVVNHSTNNVSLVDSISSSVDEAEMPPTVMKDDAIELETNTHQSHVQEGCAQEPMDQEDDEHVNFEKDDHSKPKDDEHTTSENNEHVGDTSTEETPDEVHKLSKSESAVESTLSNKNIIANSSPADSPMMNEAIIVNSDPDTEPINEVTFLADYRQQESIPLTSDDEGDSTASSNSSDSEDGSALGYESSSSESSLCWSSDEVPEKPKVLPVPKKSDLIPYDDGLPPIEDLQISVEEREAQPIGKVSHFVEHQVIVQAFPDLPAIDLDSVLFLDCGKRALGAVHDVFGSIHEPLYVVRFNSMDHIKEKKVEKGMLVFFAPQTNHTSFVILNELLRSRGSDASWKDNKEPPEKFLDYSDDEEERKAKQARKQANKPVTNGSSNEFESRVKKVRHEDSNPFRRSDNDCIITRELNHALMRQERKQPPRHKSGFREPPGCSPGARFGGPPLLRSTMAPLSSPGLNRHSRSSPDWSSPSHLRGRPPPPFSPFMNSNSDYNSFQRPFSPHENRTSHPPPFTSPSMLVPPPPHARETLPQSNQHRATTPHAFNSSPHSQEQLNSRSVPHPSVSTSSYSSVHINTPPHFAPSPLHVVPSTPIWQSTQHVPPPSPQHTIQSQSHHVVPPPPLPPMPQQTSTPPQHVAHPLPSPHHMVTLPSHVALPFSQNAPQPSPQHSVPPPPQHGMPPPHNVAPPSTHHALPQYTMPPQYSMVPPQQQHSFPAHLQQTVPPPTQSGCNVSSHHLVPPPPPPPPPPQPPTSHLAQHVQHPQPFPPTTYAAPQHNFYPPF